jgi:hypothetical protein
MAARLYVVGLVAAGGILQADRRYVEIVRLYPIHVAVQSTTSKLLSVIGAMARGHELAMFTYVVARVGAKMRS